MTDVWDDFNGRGRSQTVPYVSFGAFACRTPPSGVSAYTIEDAFRATVGFKQTLQ